MKGRKWRLDLPALLKKTPAQKGVAEWGAAAAWKQGRSHKDPNQCQGCETPGAGKKQPASQSRAEGQ